MTATRRAFAGFVFFAERIICAARIEFAFTQTRRRRGLLRIGIGTGIAAVAALARRLFLKTILIGISGQRRACAGFFGWQNFHFHPCVFHPVWRVTAEASVVELVKHRAAIWN